MSAEPLNANRAQSTQINGRGAVIIIIIIVFILSFYFYR